MKIKEFPNYCTVTALLRVSFKEEKKLEAELWASLWARERTLSFQDCLQFFYTL